MSKAERQLAQARAARDAARAEFDDQFHRLRGDPEAETIGERLIGRLGEDAKSSMDRALDVASESKGVAAATTAALALWFLREPILTWLGGLLHRRGDAEDMTDTPDEVTRDAN